MHALGAFVLAAQLALIDSGSPLGHLPTGCSKWARAFSHPSSAWPRKATLLRNGEAAAACRFMPSFETRGMGKRLSPVFPNMMCEPPPDALYGPVIVEEPQSSKPLLRVSRTTDDIEEIEGCRDIRLVNTIGWGDGHHATTRLCLDFLARHAGELPSQQILDYGTGSGVLGIAASKLGCKGVIGVDIDDEALDAAYENLEENGIDDKQMLLCHTREIVQDLDGIGLRDEPGQAAMKFDVVIANILVGPLMKLAPVLALCVKDGSGRLCLCGLREEQIPALETEYAKYGVEFEAVHTRRHEQWREGAEGEGVWAQVTARKRALTDAERKQLLRELNERAVS